MLHLQDIRANCLLQYNPFGEIWAKTLSLSHPVRHVSNSKHVFSDIYRVRSVRLGVSKAGKKVYCDFHNEITAKFGILTAKFGDFKFNRDKHVSLFKSTTEEEVELVGLGH
jgi:hypothetical protein